MRVRFCVVLTAEAQLRRVSFEFGAAERNGAIGLHHPAELATVRPAYDEPRFNEFRLLRNIFRVYDVFSCDLMNSGLLLIP